MVKARLVKRLGAVDAATLTAVPAVLRDTFEA